MWYPFKRYWERLGEERADLEAKQKARHEELEATLARFQKRREESKAKLREEEELAKSQGLTEWANFWVRRGNTDYANYLFLYYIAEKLGIDKQEPDTSEEIDEKS